MPHSKATICLSCNRLGISCSFDNTLEILSEPIIDHSNTLPEQKFYLDPELFGGDGAPDKSSVPVPKTNELAEDSSRTTFQDPLTQRYSQPERPLEGLKELEDGAYGTDQLPVADASISNQPDPLVELFYTSSSSPWQCPECPRSFTTTAGRMYVSVLNKYSGSKTDWNLVITHNIDMTSYVPCQDADGLTTRVEISTNTWSLLTSYPASGGVP